MPPIPDQIIGHAQQCRELLNDLGKGNVAHAYLFVGPPHLGKFTVARWFAWQLMAHGLAADAAAVVREQMERLIHPDYLCLDLLWIDGVQEDWGVISRASNVPQEHRSKGTTAKTDTIGINDVQALIDRLYEAGSSQYVCCVVRCAERLTTEAANAFLKILEEPPSRVVFLLTADDEHALLPTVVSRTRVLRFAPLSRADLRLFLHGRDDDDAAFALHLAGGAPGMLLNLLTDADLLRSHKQLHAQARQFWQTTSLSARMSAVAPYGDRHRESTTFLLHLGLTLREHPDPVERARWSHAYAALIKDMDTNAHRALLLQRFVLAVTTAAC